MRVDAPDCRHALLYRIVNETLERDGRGLGHPVADRDLRHVQLVEHPLHHLDGAACPGHDAGPERRQVVSSLARFLERGDEHGRHAVERRAARLGNRVQRLRGIEAFAGKHHCRALRHAAQHPHNHAEAVVERHRNAQRIPLGQPDTVGNEPRVVDDVAVGERGALGRTGSAGGELDIDRVVRAEAPGHGVQPRHLCRPSEPDRIVEAEYPRAGIVAHRDYGFEMRQCR